MWRRLVRRRASSSGRRRSRRGRPSPGRWWPAADAVRRPPEAQLADAIWNEVRREAGLRRRRLEALPWPEHLDAAGARGRPPRALARAPGRRRGRGVLTPRQVVVVAETRVEGRPMAEVAQALGPPRTERSTRSAGGPRRRCGPSPSPTTGRRLRS